MCSLGNVIPGTFGEAVVACVRKSKSAAPPLDYRPISIINSDYKIFTQIYASRLRPMLPHLVHLLQTGFLPRREMETVIDVLVATKICASSDPDLHRTLVLLWMSQRHTIRFRVTSSLPR